MRIAIATVQVPFVRGGAEAMSDMLCQALQNAGHEVEIVSLPFRFFPPAVVSQNIDAWQAQDFDSLDVGAIDLVIALKFPAYNLRHSKKVVWLMHQHRSVYDLLDTPYGESSSNQDAMTLREKIIETDNASLLSAKSVFTISRNVSARLLKNNGIASKALYQPPYGAEYLRAGPIFPYIYVPSRLEELKRQNLLIEAMRFVREPVIAVIAGEGGAYQRYLGLVRTYGLERRVRFVGRVNDNAMRNYYSNALSIFFGPYDEDYGFITLEAMLSAKPVITCTDSGGPTEFVVDQETGYVVPPEPKAIADVINGLWTNRSKAVRMGCNGLQHYRALNISWHNVVKTLLGE